MHEEKIMLAKDVAQGFGYFFFETKQLHKWVSAIRTKLHPLVHIRDGAILHKPRPRFRG